MSRARSHHDEALVLAQQGLAKAERLASGKESPRESAIEAQPQGARAAEPQTEPQGLRQRQLGWLREKGGSQTPQLVGECPQRAYRQSPGAGSSAA